ncbi:hypothetical protein P5P86_11910 [Nocardioides sp. BP30]|uniref:hypothetical protein n=1 Tax=Nocardioides sp. BP30 TaxID=3036374 RepID=UPI002468C1A3|nr:hypothetical protein [Nocardioides sp. BP30]WGL50669.1 hypothetical protein P5P86_11910 [Nocardioides sp. BP30]
MASLSRCNPWVRFCWEHWHLLAHTWELACEAETKGYATEIAEYAEQHPRPLFRDALIHLSPAWRATHPHLTERADQRAA